MAHGLTAMTKSKAIAIDINQIWDKVQIQLISQCNWGILSEIDPSYQTIIDQFLDIIYLIKEV